MTRRITYLSCLAFCLAVAVGCAKQAPIQQTSGFYDQCISYVTIEVCEQYQTLCRSYADIFNKKYANFGQCLAQCTQTANDNQQRYALRGCSADNETASNHCEENCRALYPPSPGM
ncbi:MAG: hypothetical protein AB7D37_02430 [Desulfovibrio sp.]